MSIEYTCDFNMQKCIKTLGVEEKGKVQNYVTNEVLRLSSPYIPLDEGTLLASGHIENGTDVVWGGGSIPYAAYQWGGIVYEDPMLHCAGFQVADGGWRSRKGVQKVPTERSLTYQNGDLRGPRWVLRMLQNGGLQKIQDGARRIVGQ